MDKNPIKVVPLNYSICKDVDFLNLYKVGNQIKVEMSRAMEKKPEKESIKIVIDDEISFFKI